MTVNIVELLEELPEAQHGYFTRAQAVEAGVEDYDLHRAASKGFIARVGHGVYRVAGAPTDPCADLRVAWLRLRPDVGPRQRLSHPDIWVSHESAASVLGFGVFLAETPTFTTSQRVQPSKTVRTHRRSAGLQRSEWIVVNGFAVTAVERTAADLFAAGVDGGHLGRFIAEAIRAGATEPNRVRAALEMTIDEYDALIGMSENSAVRS